MLSSIGWTDPEGTRPFLAALLLAYYDPEGRLIYAGHAGTGIGHWGARTAVAPPAAAGDPRYAARPGAAARQPLRIAAGP
jgi:hypothetical protein